MTEFILLMHDDVLEPAIANDDKRWDAYIAQLRASGQFDGGSAIGSGAIFKKDGARQPARLAVNGFICVRADNIEAAAKFLAGNPVFEAGGSVEIRELPRT